MTQREEFKSAAYFEERIEILQESIQEELREIDTSLYLMVKPQMAYYGVFLDSYRVFIARYSRGDTWGGRVKQERLGW